MASQAFKILAIDDNRDNLIALTAVLGDRLPHANILTVTDGAKGIEMARAQDPDVILLDIIMPAMDGFAVCRELKQDEHLQAIPVLFLTALRTDRESRIMALEAGGEGFLNKPFDEVELVVQIRAMAKIRAANRLQQHEKDQLEKLVAERTRKLEQELAERKRVEEERETLQAQLIQAQKMESVGRLAGGVAHDFNNMLGVILGHTELALTHMEPGQPLFAELREIQKAAQRSADLTRQLLSFARKQTIAPKVLDLNETVEGMLNMLARLIGEDIHLAVNFKPNLWLVKVDPSQIDQILANLCVNARDAIAGVGRITIETENVVVGDGQCSNSFPCAPGEFVMVAVSDDGCGMDAQVLSKVFEPFFTTKGTGQGTGLGLATVYGIVEQNNGFINISSQPGHGSTFKIFLPRHATDAKPIKKAGPAALDLRGHETILLVEDDPAILNLAMSMLKHQGYTVLCAATTQKATRLAECHAGDIHLLMTDVIMPEMNGQELAQRLMSLYPRLKCLFMSGYTADIIAPKGVLDDGIHFIQKPFSMAALAAKVREALDGNDRFK
jgi:signal transduction histidine kinase